MSSLNNNFSSLCSEMSLHIVSFLSVHDLCVLARTSRYLRQFSSVNKMWKELCTSNGWTVTHTTARKSGPDQFDYKKYFADKTLITRPGIVKRGETGNIWGAIPSKRFKHTATVVGKYIVFIGGMETDLKRFNEIVYFDTEGEYFSTPIINGDTVPNFARHTSCLVGSKVYIFGGFDGYTTFFDLATFDPHSHTWTNIPATAQKGTAPSSRSNHAAASVGTNMYIFGGNNTDMDNRYQVLGDLSMLDTRTMTWSCPKTTGSVPSARSGHTLTAIGTKLYLFGGGEWHDSDGWKQKFNDLHIFDTETLHWTNPTCDGTADASTFPIPFTLGRFLCHFGGGSQPLLHAHVTRELTVLDTTALVRSVPWGDISAQLQPRDMGTASVVGDTVYLFGGYAGEAIDYFDKLTISCAPMLIAGGDAVHV